MNEIKCPQCGSDVKGNICSNCGKELLEPENHIIENYSVQEDLTKSGENINGHSENEKSFSESDTESYQEYVKDGNNFPEDNSINKGSSSSEPFISNTEMQQPQMNYEFPQEETMKPSKKKWMIPAIIALLLVVGVGCFAIFKPSSVSKSKEVYNITGQLDDDGNLYFIDGTDIITIKGEFSEGTLTKDRKHIVALDEDNTCYFYDQKGENRIKIADGIEGLTAIRDQGIIYKVKVDKELTADDVLNYIMEETRAKAIYEDDDFEEKLEEIEELLHKAFKESFKDNTYENAKYFYELLNEEELNEEKLLTYHSFRYTFSNQENIEIESTSISTAKDSINLMYIEDSDIYFMDTKDQEPRKVATLEEGTKGSIKNVFSNISSGVWVETDDQILVYMIEDGKKVKVGSLGESDSSRSISTGYLVNGETQVIVAEVSTGNILSKKLGDKEAKVIKTNAELSYSLLYTSEGYIGYAREEVNINDFYFFVKNGKESREDLYHYDGENKEKVIKDIKYDLMDNGYIKYSNKDDMYYIAKLKGSDIESEIKLGENVDDVEISEDGKYIYLTKEKDDVKFLYYGELEKDDIELERIAKGVTTFSISADGKFVSYVLGDDTEMGTYEIGDLYIKQIGKEEEKIASDVLGVKSDSEGYFNIKELMFYKGTGESADGDILVDLVKKNGKESETLIKELKLKYFY